jgi:hypothetical protein
MKVLPQNYSAAVLYYNHHFCKLQIKISKRQIPTYDGTHTQQPAVSDSLCQRSHKYFRMISADFGT